MNDGSLPNETIEMFCSCTYAFIHRFVLCIQYISNVWISILSFYSVLKCIYQNITHTLLFTFCVLNVVLSSNDKVYSKDTFELVELCFYTFIYFSWRRCKNPTNKKSFSEV